MCDFDDFKPDAEAECWTVTTVGKNATNRQKRRSYRNPMDRFFLVAGERPGASKDDRRTEVFINDAAAAENVANKSRGLGGGSRDRKNANRRSLKRSNCTDVQPPPSGGVLYSCAQQKEWGKCDSWFMKNGKFCDRTCGRCVDIFEDFTDDCQDYEEEEDEEDEKKETRAEAEAPALSPGASPDESPEDDKDDEDALTADVDFDGVADDVLEREDEDDDASPAPSPAPSDEEEDDDALMADVDFEGVAEEVLDYLENRDEEKRGASKEERSPGTPGGSRVVAAPSARGTARGM